MNFSADKKNGLQWLPEKKTAADRVKKVFGIIGFVFASILVFLAAYLPLTYKWSQETWSDLSIDEIVYHLTMPMEGTGNGMVVQHIVKCLVPAAIITVVFVIVMIIARKKISFTGYIKGLAAALSVVLIANTVASFWKNMEVSEYMTHQSTYSSFIDENYVDPGSITLTFPEKKRNLIYIFLESTECTFADQTVGGAFEQNVIPELTQIGLENESFSDGTKLNGGHAMSGATWTMGAMFAQTSGLPLTISIDGNAMSTQAEFFPGATTLGDILAKEGYNQTLLLGSDAVFGGRELYFTTHGNYNIRDYKYYTSNGTLPSDYYVWWGYEDKYLFENAKTELAELSASSEPFNLTMLTVDTHFEDGYVCSECPNTYADQYSNVYACASKQVSEFLEWIKQQPYYDNTTVVISGDHLTMDKDYCNGIDPAYDRKVFTTIINGPVQSSSNEIREYTTFDNFPTTLAALGVTIPGDKLALGTNLYSGQNTLFETYGKKVFNDGIKSKSELMDNLTAGIVTKMVDINVLDYNTETRTQQVIANNINVPGSDNIDLLKAVVWRGNDTAGSKTYGGENRGDGSWIFNIPFADFDFVGGQYTVKIVGRDTTANNPRDYAMGSTTVDMRDTEMASLVASGEVVHGSGIYVTDFDFTTGNFGIEYSRSDASNIVRVSFAVWQNNDQSDIRWYEAEIGDDGVYRKLINAFEFGAVGKPYLIHVYITTNDGQTTYADSVTYSIS